MAEANGGLGRLQLDPTPPQSRSNEVDRRWLIGGALATGAAMVAVPERIDPWPAGVVWLVAWGAFSYGVTAITTSYLLRALAMVLSLWIAFSFWQSTVPRADIQIINATRVADGKIPPDPLGVFDHIAVSIAFKNDGKRSASFYSPGVSQVVQVNKIRTREEQMRVEDEMHRELEQLYVSGTSGSNPIKPQTVLSGASSFHTFDRPVFMGLRKRFEDGDYVFIVAGQIRYRDWWFFEREPTEYCYIFYAKTAQKSCIQYNSDAD